MIVFLDVVKVVSMMIIVTIRKVRFSDLPLPVMSNYQARALQMCTSSSSSHHDTPDVDGMLPIWNISHLQQTYGFEFADLHGGSDDASVIHPFHDEDFSSVMCESRSVRELVQLCIMSNVSAINSVLLIHTPQPISPIQLLPYIQASSPFIL
jgi:hypothetical protein